MAVSRCEANKVKFGQQMLKVSAKKQVIKAGIELSRSGLIARTWGNVSCRTDEEHFVITASGRSYLTITEDEVIEVKIDDLSYEGDIKPSSEKKIHREIYRLKKEAGFVIHTHQSNASAVAAMGLKRIKLDRDYTGIGDYVLCADYGLPGTKKLCSNTAAALREYDGKAVIMSNHGAVCYGKDYAEAFQVVNSLEEACGKYLESLGIEPWKGSGSDASCKGAGADNVGTSESKEDTGAYGALWNDSPVIMKYMEVRDVLKPYLDDFAQLAGTAVKVVDDKEKTIAKAIKASKPILVRGRGLLCAAEERSDAEALSIVIEKNCRAALAAIGSDPINPLECIIMRRFYLRKYSKRKEEIKGITATAAEELGLELK